MAGLDELDERLLELLRDDARASFVELADALDTSEGTVRSRLKRLVDNGTIRRFTIRTAGIGVKALIGVRVAPHVPTNRLSKKIRELTGVTDVWEVSGETDILARVDVPTTEGLDDVVEKIRTMADVDGTDSRLILREL